MTARAESMNPFDHASVATRYAVGRPRSHAGIVARIKDTLGLTERVERALDVGCGTGLSSRALLTLARRVDGIDASAAMLAVAEFTDGVTYHVASAEELPFPSETFDLITVSSALHWFDRERFLAEAVRVLKGGAHLVIYENAFPGVMLSNPRFQPWQRQFYSRFPRTPRNTSRLTEDEVRQHGLRFVAQQEYTNVVDFTLQDLSLYLSTQTNAIEAIENGRHTVESFRSLVEQEAAEFFADGEVAPFEFVGFIWVLENVR